MAQWWGLRQATSWNSGRSPQINIFLCRSVAPYLPRYTVWAAVIAVSRCRQLAGMEVQHEVPSTTHDHYFETEVIAHPNGNGVIFHSTVFHSQAADRRWTRVYNNNLPTNAHSCLVHWIHSVTCQSHCTVHYKCYHHCIHTVTLLHISALQWPSSAVLIHFVSRVNRIPVQVSISGRQNVLTC